MLSVCHGQFAGVLADSTLAKMADFPPPEKVSFMQNYAKKSQKLKRKTIARPFEILEYFSKKYRAMLFRTEMVPVTM